MKKALMAIGLSSDIGALAAGVTLTTRIPVCPTGGPGAPGDGRCALSTVLFVAAMLIHLQPGDCFDRQQHLWSVYSVGMLCRAFIRISSRWKDDGERRDDSGILCIFLCREYRFRCSEW